jgi:hypothetical protein
MEILSSKIPEGWRNNLEGQRQFVEENGVVLLTEKEVETITLSVVLLPSLDDRKTINEKMRDALPERLNEYVVWQPWEGYHFSVQWVLKENLKGMDLETLVDSIKSSLNTEDAIKGKMIYPLLGKKNLFGIFNAENANHLVNMRNKLGSIWQEQDWKIGIPEGAYGLAWMSLVRFKKEIPDDLIRELMDLKPITSDLTVDTVRVSINDEFLTPNKTKVLGEIDLVK